MISSLAIASDHGGYQYKELIKEYLSKNYPTIKVQDRGPQDEASVDYPDFAQAVAQDINSNQAQAGILICGSGIGISIAANRHEGIRAALCTSETMAKLTRQHNNANILALGQRIIGIETALACVKAFIETPFEGGRHEARIAKIENFKS